MASKREVELGLKPPDTDAGGGDAVGDESPEGGPVMHVAISPRWAGLYPGTVAPEEKPLPLLARGPDLLPDLRLLDHPQPQAQLTGSLASGASL